MDVAAFSQAKNPDRPEDNEDRILIVAGRAYGVIDGVTDKMGHRFDGLTGGQIAGRIVERAVRQACSEDVERSPHGQDLIDRINREFAAAFGRLGIEPTSQASLAAQLAAHLVLAQIDGSQARFLVVGDAGLRLNGCEVFHNDFPLDKIGAAVRKAVWRYVMARDPDPEAANRVARAYTVAGLKAVLPDAAEWIDADDLASIRRIALAEAEVILPEISRSVIGTAINGGMHEQHRFANSIHPLGFPTLNGFPIPSSMVIEFERPLDTIESIEMFSDGYFGCPDGTELDDWEDWFARVEAEDPAKVDGHASTKGSFAGQYADDRTVLILRCGRDAKRRMESDPDDVRMEHGVATS